MSIRVILLALVMGVASVAGAYMVFYWVPSVESGAAQRVKAVTQRHLDTVVEALIPFLLQQEYASVNATLDAVKARNPEWVRLELYSANALRIYPIVEKPKKILNRENLNVFERDITVKGKLLGRLIMSADLEQARHERRRETFQLAWVLGVAFILVLIGMVVVLELLVRRPVNRLIVAAQRLAKGDYETALPVPQGNEIGALITAFDAMRNSINTTQKALTQSEARFRDFGASAADWYWEMDEKLCFCYLSSRFGEVTGMAQADLLGKRADGVGILGIDVEQWRRHMRVLHAHRPFRNFVCTNTRPDRSQVWVSINGRPVFDEHGRFQGYRGTGADVTAGKMAELELSMAKEAAERAQKLAEEANQAKTLFLSSMSHELRTPMNAILGFGQILKLGKLAQGQQEPVDQILKSGNHLLDLINQILDLSRIDTGNISLSIENVRARDIINQCIDMARTLGNKVGIVIQDKTEGQELPLLRADNTRLIQSLLNLLSNAVKYNRLRGKVTLEAHQDGDMLRFIVRDQGEGIAEDKQASLFEPFNRLGAEASNVEGTGIGLTITRELVELMDGKIGFESRPGTGSSFWIDIPVSTQKPKKNKALWSKRKKAARQAMSRAPDTGRFRILYVEDNKANADLMKAIFKEFEVYNLICVGSAEAAFKSLEKALPDLILMDIDLPGMKGGEALQILKKREDTCAIPVIAVSADILPASIDDALRQGFRDYITKPFDISKIVQVVDGVMKATFPT